MNSVAKKTKKQTAGKGGDKSVKTPAAKKVSASKSAATAKPIKKPSVPVKKAALGKGSIKAVKAVKSDLNATAARKEMPALDLNAYYRHAFVRSMHG